MLLRGVLLLLTGLTWATQALEVADIRFHTQKNTLKQILIQFDQDIAQPGQVPSHAQLAHITLTDQYKQQCRWRYVAFNKLSCDIHTKTSAYKPVKVRVEAGFPGLHSQLQNDRAAKWHSANWPVYIGEREETQLQLVYSADTETDKRVVWDITHSLTFKLNDQSIVPTARHYEIPDSRQSYQLTFDFAESIDNGKLEVALPAGFQPTETHIALPASQPIHSPEQRPEPEVEAEFKGLFCVKPFPRASFWQNAFKALPPEEAGSCAPEALALGFTHRVEKFWLMESVLSASVATQPVIIKGNARESHESDLYYYPIALKGETDYQLDLSALRSDSTGHPFKKAGMLTLSTGPSSPYWHISEQSGSAYRARTPAALSLSTRNTADLSIQFYPVFELAQLHHWLQTKDKSELLMPLSDMPRHMDNQIHQTNLPVSDHLKDRSGILFYALQGPGSSSVYDSQITVRKQQQTLTASDFNLSVHHGSGITLYNTEFDTDKAIADVDIYLACASFSAPKYLGQSNQQGLLTLPPEQWQSLQPQNNADCWLWASKDTTHAIMALTPQSTAAISGELLKSQPIYQPNSAIDLSVILYRHTSDGLQPVLNNIELTLQRRGSEHKARLAQQSVSEFGLRQFHLPEGVDKQGRYHVHAKVANTSHFLGSIYVSEFIPPEIEFTWQHPDTAYKDRPLNVSVSGKTMNGFDAGNLSGELKYQFIRFGYSDLPSGWPQEYDFSSRREKPASQRNNAIPLSTNGTLSSATFTPTETLPLVKLALSGRVVSEQGEVQFFNQQLTYLSREHYIGVREQDGQVHIIAVDHSGNPVSVPASVHMEVSTTEQGQQRKEQVLLCEIQTPATCALPDNESNFFYLDIHSGKQGYLWRRTVFRSDSSPDESESVAQFGLTGKKHITAQAEYTFSVNALRNGEILAFITAGEYQSLRTFTVKKGSNDLTLQVPPSWLPGFRITAVMPYSDHHREALHQQWLSDASTAQLEWQALPRFTRAVSASALPTKPDMRGQFASLSVEVRPANALSIRVEHPETVSASGQLDIRVSSDQDADIQLWLVNDALFNIANAQAGETHLNRLFNREGYQQSLISDYNLSDRLVASQFIQQLDEQSFKAQYEAMMVTRSRLAPPDTLSQALANTIWQPVIPLKANQTKTVSLQLPQLLGRWRVFVVALNSQSTQTYTNTITSHAGLEYHLSHAAHFIQGDKAIVTIRAENRLGKPLQDKVRLTLNDKTLAEHAIEVREQEPQLLDVTLPELPPGEYILQLHSERMTFPRLSEFRVSDSSRIVQQSWLLDPARQNTVTLAEGVQVESAEAHSIEQLAPNWSALQQHHQHYPHQCWEQTLSRALSYSVNPLASELWPEGKQALQQMITKGATENSSWQFGTGYAYYPHTYPDPMLSAYTLLVSQWLNNSSLNLTIDKTIPEAISQDLLEALHIAEHQRRAFDDDSADWQWWALAQSRQVTLEQVLSWRHTFGVTGTRSNLLQLLAMKALGHEQPELERALTRVLDTGFEDQTLSALSGPLEQCLALLLTERRALKAQLSKLAISRQHRQGHFGNTLNDGICALALQDHQHNAAAPVSLTASPDARSNEYKIKTPLAEPYWLTVQTRQPLSLSKTQSNGLDVTRRYHIYSNDKWQLFAGQAIKPGDLIKVTLEVFSADKRAHVLLTDTLPGGLRLLNPQHSHTQYKNWLKADSPDTSLLMQQTSQGAQQVLWHQAYLSAGTTTFEYLAQAQASGNYLAPPASVEMMYQPEIAGDSNAQEVPISTRP
ncbi:hypothetical protein [Pseudoalteromonas rubra]|uniref:Alpha-2-macroglobulin domain-containing protein n=1 Tax=Pseudoalteromonas rubra TaxID=43658 RepID=A0A5S3X5Q1_9GAMM|nr:hypothetical protein [Pseudoalteromonas rubra]TMP39265.1 hypothetical protein CWB98_01370 [Pseudoalteromonas rubra]